MSSVKFIKLFFIKFTCAYRCHLVFLEPGPHKIGLADQIGKPIYSDQEYRIKPVNGGFKLRILSIRTI